MTNPNLRNHQIDPQLIEPCQLITWICITSIRTKVAAPRNLLCQLMNE